MGSWKKTTNKFKLRSKSFELNFTQIIIDSADEKNNSAKPIPWWILLTELVLSILSNLKNLFSS